jgi:NAD-dependent deacetylase
MKYQSIVILTGAGISAESGIKTFRGSDGLWENHQIQDVASPEGFQRDPALVYRFYNERRRQLISDQVQPNPAHHALTQLEKDFNGSFLLITQNIDDLHERSEQKNIIHMHGELLKMRCQRTGKVYPTREDFDAQSICECCQEKGHLRPHIVWFGEMPHFMERIQVALEDCDLFISIGTSGLVYPAALFSQWTPYGAHKIEINLDRTQVSGQFHETLIGPASEMVPSIVKRILN